MTEVLELPQPRIKRRQKKSNKNLISQESEDRKEDILLEQFRQSIEKGDDNGTTEKNLFNPAHEPDKLGSRRRKKHRDRDKLEAEPETDGRVNGAFVSDETGIGEIVKNETNLPHSVDEHDLYVKPRKERNKNRQTKETRNEELSNLPIENIRKVNGDEMKEVGEEERQNVRTHHKRRRKKDPEKDIVTDGEPVEMKQEEKQNKEEGGEEGDEDEEIEDETTKKNVKNRHKSHKSRSKKKLEENKIKEKGHENEIMNENVDDNEIDKVIVYPLEIPDDGKVLSITIHRSDRLKTDINVLHPMVRISIVDMSTGTLLAKQNRDRKVVSCNEDTERVSYILPIITQPYQFKFSRCTIPTWKESFILNENSNYFINNLNVIFFFEIIDLKDCGRLLSSSTATKSDSFRHVAWGFLLPISRNHIRNTDHRVRLQLYECGSEYIMANNLSDPLSPAVYHWWKRGLRQQYPSTLYVSIESIRLNVETQEVSKIVSRSMQPDILEGHIEGSNDMGGLMSGLQLTGKLGMGDGVSGRGLHQWARLPGQLCHIPNASITNINLANTSFNKPACSIVKFSPNGHYLAAAITSQSSDAASVAVIIYDLYNSNIYNPIIKNTYTNAHNRLIHGMAWCPHSLWLATASADGTCVIWYVGSVKSTETIRDTVIRKTLSHPCFIYCVQFHPRTSHLLVTAGYDRVIRLWNIKSDSKELLQTLDGHQGYINCMIFSDPRNQGGTSGDIMLFSGDSHGHIRIWSCPTTIMSSTTEDANYDTSHRWTQIDQIVEQDIANIVINTLCLSPTGRRLYVHTRDGIIRLIDLKIKTSVQRFMGITNTDCNLHSCLTPCGSFLFCGNEDMTDGCQICIWNAQTGDVVAIYKNITLTDAPVSTIDYHPSCHLVAFSGLATNARIIVYGYKYEDQLLTNDNNSIEINNRTVSPTDVGQSIFDDPTPNDFSTFQKQLERKKMDRMTTIVNSLNSVTMASQTLKRGAKSIERYNSRLEGYESGPEDRGRMVRSLQKSNAIEAIPLSLTMSSPRKANFTFKPPPPIANRSSSVGRNRNGTKYLGDVVVLYDYQAQRADELTLVRGEVVRVVFKDGANWLVGETGDGIQGYFPSNYVAGSEDLVPSAEVSLIEEQKPQECMKDDKAKRKVVKLNVPLVETIPDQSPISDDVDNCNKLDEDKKVPPSPSSHRRHNRNRQRHHADPIL